MRRQSPTAVVGRPRAPESGFTLLELLFAMGLVALLGAFGTSSVSHWRARTRGEGAARHVMHQIRVARLVAARDRANVALVFTTEANGDVAFRLHRDGNGNGVRRSEAERGIDPPVTDLTVLSHWYPGAAFRVSRDLPAIDDGSAIGAGSDPIRLSGGGRILSCTPLGAATGGTLYLSGPSEHTFAVRVLGTTGRLRLFEYKPHMATWEERW